MALFSGILKKIQNELDSTAIDWEKLVTLSTSKYELSGKSAAEGKALVNSLVRRAVDFNGDYRILAQLFRNISAHGGDFNRSLNPAGETPIFIASGIENSTLLKSLLEAGVQPSAATHKGFTALHTAVESGYLEKVRLLLAAGADPGAEDASGNSPLHLSALLEKPDEIVKLLLAAGAKAYHRNSAGKTPVDLALGKGNSSSVELLRESLRIIRRNRSRNWSCPKCRKPMNRPPLEKVVWYLSLDMWDYLQFTCGNCGNAAFATVLDGEV
jgi:hypothetical protein